MYLDGSFWGFIFFNSRTPGALAEQVLCTLDLYAHLITAIVTAEMLSVRILAAAVKTAHDMVHFRDPETGGHIDRMARYARLIAQHLAATGAASLDDAAIERIFEFAPLHDIGKLAVPDRILLKPARLSITEREEMKQHTVRGLEMIEDIAHNFGLEHLDGLDLLRHIAESHHETLDGGGYPHGLHGGEIPLEARIVAVADVFDALTSLRPYKPSWTNDEAFAWLRKLSRSKFDEDCVDALLFNKKKVKEIQAQFHDPVTDPLSSSAGQLT
jgi:HD-GYP domain-containing protein (c-di-GMP phosphodiesterase class II)